MLGVQSRPQADGPAPPACAGRAAVRVVAPARLHLGFLDPGATLGRRFGSIGLVIEGFDTIVSLAAMPPGQGDRWEAAGPHEQQALPRAREVVAALRQATGRTGAMTVRVEQVPPAHAGFGTGTQLALSLGRAFALLHELPLDTPSIAAITGRGLRSGVGVAGFDHGGLLVDAGPGAKGGPPPLIARVELPAAWRVLLVLDPRTQGLHGGAERAALAKLPPLDASSAAALCHDVLMRVLPGAIEGDFAPFAAGVNRMQALLGEHFAPAQPAGAYTSEAVGRLLGAMATQLPAAVGQSSWGPTGFAIVPAADALGPWLAQARAQGLLDPALELRVVSPRTRGAVVSRVDR